VSVTYSAAELLVLVTGIFAGFGGMIVAIITAWRTGTKVDAASKTTNTKVESTLVEIGKVHELTNDRATKQDKKIEELQGTIKVLISAMAEKDQRSAILADRKVQEASVAQGGVEERARAENQAKS